MNQLEKAITQDIKYHKDISALSHYFSKDIDKALAYIDSLNYSGPLTDILVSHAFNTAFFTCLVSNNRKQLSELLKEEVFIELCGYEKLYQTFKTTLHHSSPEEQLKTVLIIAAKNKNLINYFAKKDINVQQELTPTPFHHSP